MPLEYTEEELASFFEVTTDRERELFSTFLLTGFREQEVAFLFWSDINLKLRTIRVTSKPNLGFSPKRWEEREIPIPVELVRLLENALTSTANGSCSLRLRAIGNTTCCSNAKQWPSAQG